MWPVVHERVRLASVKSGPRAAPTAALSASRFEGQPHTRASGGSVFGRGYIGRMAQDDDGAGGFTLHSEFHGHQKEEERLAQGNREVHDREKARKEAREKGEGDAEGEG